MIVYFTGTGNSRYVAHLIQSVTGDELVSMNELIKSGNHEPLQSVKPFVFVSPIYAWKIPRIVEEFIRDTELTGTKKVYFIFTCGDDAGNAGYFAKKIIKEKGLEFLGHKAIKMPENYIILFKAPDEEESKAKIERAIPVVKDVANMIKTGQSLSEDSVSLMDRFKSSIINSVFYKYNVSAKKYYSTGSCTHCGKCVSLCPLNNISLKEGKPQWGENCTHCMACICGCPSQSIEYGKKTIGKRRYFLGI